MLILRTSQVSKETRIMEIDISEEDYQDLMNGIRTQEICENLTLEEYEFIKYGISEDDWDLMLDLCFDQGDDE